jgi:hypothetical protein
MTENHGVPVRIRVPPLRKFLQKRNKREGAANAPGPLYTNHYTNALFQSVLHRACRLLAHAGQDVRVSVEGDADV